MDPVHFGFSYLLSDRFVEDARLGVTASRILVGGWLILSSSQWLVAASLFSEDGPLPWQALGRTPKRPMIARLRRRLSTPALRLWLTVQLAGSVLLLAGIAPLPTGVLLLASYGLLILLSGEFWSDGADKMGMIALAGTVLSGAGIATDDPLLILSGIVTVGGQLTLCYFVAGTSKLFVAGWRQGVELSDVMGTELWGSPLARRATRHPAGALIAAWGVMLIEALFPLALLAPLPWLLTALSVLFAFHVATAVVMRLNLFPFAFVSAYPAAILISRVVRASLGWTV